MRALRLHQVEVWNERECVAFVQVCRAGLCNSTQESRQSIIVGYSKRKGSRIACRL